MALSIVSIDYKNHALRYSLFMMCVCLLRFQIVADSVSTILPWDPADDELLEVEPLSILNWVLHSLTMPLGWEVIRECFRKGSHVSDQARTFGLIFVIGDIQGWLFLASHALIKRHEILERQLYAMGELLLKVQVLSSGALMLGRLVPRNPWRAIILLTVACAVLTDHISFDSATGRALSTLSLVLVPVKVGPETLHSLLFVLGWASLSLAPVLAGFLFGSNNKGSDSVHLVSTLLLDVCLALIVMSMVRLDSTFKSKSKVEE